MVGIRRFPCQPLRFYSFSTSSKPSPAELKYDPLVGYKNPDRPVATRRTDGSPSYGEPIRISRDRIGTEFPRYPYHSVTKILKETMSTDSKLALERWKLKKIAELGRDGFEVFSKRTMSRGHLLHKRIEHYLLHQELPEIASSDHPEDDEISANHLRSITPILKDFTKPFALESRVVHPVLKYQGYTDCVAVYKSKYLCLIDWKTSERQKPNLKSTYDNPTQVAAYIGALNHDPCYNIRVAHGCIVVAYNDGAPAQVLPMSNMHLEKHWCLWLEKLKLYQKMMEYNDQS